MVSYIDMEIEKAKARQYPMGVHISPKKAKGGFGKYTAHRGLSKGVRSDRMITFYKIGMSPREKMIEKVKIYSLIHFTFKGKEKAGILLKYNKDTFTVQMVGETAKKAILYKNFIMSTDKIIIPIEPVKAPVYSGKMRNNDAKERFMMFHKLYGNASFTFKGEKVEGLITGINATSFTVKIAGIKNKKAIRFDHFLEMV